MSSAEFSLWLALYKKAPWDDSRMDIGFGLVCSTVANYAGRVLPDGSTKTPSDYMPFLEKPPEIEPDPMEHFGKF